MCEKCGKGFGCHCLREYNFSVDLKRTDLYELGRREQYFKWIDFPIEITEDICEIQALPKGAKIEYKFPVDENYTESVTYTGTEKLWKEYKCNCDITLLMREGCKCGGK